MHQSAESASCYYRPIPIGKAANGPLQVLSEVEQRYVEELEGHLPPGQP